MTRNPCRISVHRAADVCPSIQTPEGLIEIGDVMPPSEGYGQNMSTFRRDAVCIVDVLFRCLPGGTIDQLVAEILRRKASQFVVPLLSEEQCLPMDQSAESSADVQR